MAKKVYCINCKYCDIQDACSYQSYYKRVDYPLLFIYTKTYTNLIFKLNRNNACKYYKRKWWKFWVK